MEGIKILIGLIIFLSLIGIVNASECKAGVYPCNEDVNFQNLDAKVITFDNNTGSVNDSLFWQGHTGTDGSWLTGILNNYNHTIATYNLYNSIWSSTFNQTYHNKADYQFNNNNFNGSGSFNTTGTGTFGTIYAVDNAKHYFGTGNNFSISFDGTYGIFSSAPNGYRLNTATGEHPHYYGLGIDMNPTYALDVYGVARALEFKCGDITQRNSYTYGRIYMPTTGISIRRQIADAVPVLDIWQKHADSTGDILQLKNATTTVTTFGLNGDITTIGTIGAGAITGTSLNAGDGFTGSCVNITYSGGIAISCND